MFRSFLFHKPYGILSQFTEEAGKPSLAHYGPFPKDVYAAGRLDADSEGLLFLTNDNELKHLLMDPGFGHPRTYLVQVDGVPDEPALHRLRNGLIIEGKRTRPADVTLLRREPDIPPRSVPVRSRRSIPTSWLELTLREGRNRQVRKMTAAAGYPTLRLIRIRIGSLSLDGLKQGEWREVAPQEISDLLRSRETVLKGTGTGRQRRR